MAVHTASDGPSVFVGAERDRETLVIEHARYYLFTRSQGKSFFATAPIQLHLLLVRSAGEGSRSLSYARSNRHWCLEYGSILSLALSVASPIAATGSAVMETRSNTRDKGFRCRVWLSCAERLDIFPLVDLMPTGSGGTAGRNKRDTPIRPPCSGSGAYFKRENGTTSTFSRGYTLTVRPRFAGLALAGGGRRRRSLKGRARQQSFAGRVGDLRFPCSRLAYPPPPPPRWVV
ncbi:hypothetical protein ZHAS_00021854 [Anopheles sinensis]|uniref:Uncharacterized protein n=1 Tax=Anopheles sinensis TaxID=74873 RepID=A0A084WTS0_ANOSI|nr:hypothetical protein ZHAS_00021854 [Anopheles sinensis]